MGVQFSVVKALDEQASQEVYEYDGLVGVGTSA